VSKPIENIVEGTSRRRRRRTSPREVVAAAVAVVGLGTSTAVLAVIQRRDLVDLAWAPWAIAVLTAILAAILIVPNLLRRRAADKIVDLRRRTAQMNAILAGLPFGLIVTDAAGRCLLMNAAAEEVLARPNDGERLEAWLDRRPVLTSEREREQLREGFPLIRALAGETVSDVELFVPGADSAGGRWINCRAQPLLDRHGTIEGALLAFRDTTRRHRIESVLAKERRRHEKQLQRQSAMGEVELIISEPDELKLLLDRIIATTVRYLPATYASIVLHDDATREFTLGASDVPGQAVDTTPDRVRREGGATRWIVDNRRPMSVSDVAEDPFGANPMLAEHGLQSYAGIPLLADGRALGVLYALDVEQRSFTQEDLEFLGALAARVATAVLKVRLYEQLNQTTAELRRSEARLTRRRDDLEVRVRERTRELERSHERLRIAERLAPIGTLTAGLGHDMNNVLFPIRCRLDALDWSTVPPVHRDLLQSVAQSVEYLQQLTDGLRQFSLDPEDAKASAGTTTIARWWAQVSPLLTKMLPRNITLEHDLAGSLPPLAVAPHRLTQAVLNLVVNAGDAMPDGGTVRITAEPADGGDAVRIAVADTGVGMSDETRRRAFDPFFTTKPRGLSTGLGMSLVHGVVTSSRGTIDIDSSLGRGTTVVMTIPATAAPDDETTAHGAAMVSVDDGRARAWISRELRREGYAVVDDEVDLDACAVWVVDSNEERLPAMGRFLGGGADRRVIVLGSADERWHDAGAIVIPETDDLEAIRMAVREVNLSLESGS
jgi:signal transduction histidine kinase/PAS domain-containing protein